MECPKCRREIKGNISAVDLIFCPYCGEKIAPQNLDHFSFCSSCGQKLSPESLFCPRCGKKMSPMEIVEKVRPPAEIVKQHSPSHKDIDDIAMDEVTEPIVESIPASEPKLKRAGTLLWSEISAWIAKRIEPLRYLLSGQWKLRRLYRKWAKDGVFAPEEIPSAKALNELIKETGAQPMQQNRLLFIILAALVFVAFFVFIGITMSRCK